MMQQGSDPGEGFYRLTNLTPADVVQYLPLAELPVFVGDGQALDLQGDIETQSNEQGDAACVVESVCSLLRGVDVSYMALRHEGQLKDPPPPHLGSELYRQLLQQDPDLFTLSGIAAQRPPSARAASSANLTVTPPATFGLPSKVEVPQARARDPSVSGLKAPPRKQRSQNRRPRRQGLQNLPPSASAGLDQGDGGMHAAQASGAGALPRLLEKLDDAFDKADTVDAGPGVPLGISDVKALQDEVLNVRALSLLHKVPPESLARLMALLDRCIRQGSGREIEDSIEETDDFDAILLSLEAMQSALLIMTAPNIPQLVYSEEVIEGIVEVARYYMTKNVFAFFSIQAKAQLGDATPRVEEGEDDEKDEGDAPAVKQGRKRSKSAGGRATKSFSARTMKMVHAVMNKLCSITGLLAELLAVQRLQDSVVLQLSKSTLTTLAVESIQVLQLKAMGVVCTICECYPQHRTLILDELISTLWKLPTGKRGRTYHLPGDEPRYIQMVTAFLLHLIQSCAQLPGGGAAGTTADGAAAAQGKAKQADLPDSESDGGFEAAAAAAKHFCKQVVQRWGAAKGEAFQEIKLAVENLMADLEATLNAPEFPSASLLLQVFCSILFTPLGIQSKEAATRGLAIDYLGSVAARLQVDAVSCDSDRLWLLNELRSGGDGAGQQHANGTPLCLICSKGFDGRAADVACHGCQKRFHGDCMGAGGLVGDRRPFLCQVCFCRQQLAAFGFAVGASKENGMDLDKEAIGDAGVAVVQQVLLNYLEQTVPYDTTVKYAIRFHLCQWLRDEQQLPQSLQRIRGGVAKGTKSGDPAAGNLSLGSLASLPREVIARVAIGLGQRRPLMRGFDRILDNLVAALQESSPIPRAKALRAIRSIVEVNPAFLGEPRVQQAVEGRFLDSAISVREAAMELVGKHIVGRPDFALQYYGHLAERIMDTGVSVRKRVIKILREVCCTQPNFRHKNDAFKRILSRINDDEDSIQDLVGRTFQELWFAESLPGLHHLPHRSIEERTQELVAVLRGLASHAPLVFIIKRSLGQCTPAAVDKKAPQTSVAEQEAVRRICREMCSCLLDKVLEAEERAAHEGDIRALPYVLAMNAFCAIDPHFCTPAQDPAKFAVTLQPYLKTQVTTKDAAQMLLSLVEVLTGVLPLLRHPPQSLTEALVSELRSLVVKHQYLTVVQGSIKCLCALGKVAAQRGAGAVRVLIQFFFGKLDELRRWEEMGVAQREQAGKPKLNPANVARCLFALGLLCRYGSYTIPELHVIGISKATVVAVYKHFLRSQAFDVKCRALQGLGFIFAAWPDLLLDEKMAGMIRATLSKKADHRLKVQSLKNMCEFLQEAEESMGQGNQQASTEEESPSHATGVVPEAAGAGDSSVGGGIVNQHWDRVLDRALDDRVDVRQAAIKLVEVVLRQGLVHPITCVPCLVALEVDPHDSVRKVAHRLLLQLNEKYPSFLDSKISEGLEQSFVFQEQLRAHVNHAQPPSSPPPLGQSRTVVVVDDEARAGIARVFKLAAANRNSRHKFLHSVVRRFDSNGTVNLHFLAYCADTLAYLPFTLLEDPLYVITKINQIVHIRGANILASLKAAATGDGPLATAVAAAVVEDGTPVSDAYAVEDGPGKVKAEHGSRLLATRQDQLEELSDACCAGSAIALALLLKHYLRLAYGISDTRVQVFTSSEQLKCSEPAVRNPLVPLFDLSVVPLDPPTTIAQMAHSYQIIKKLYKEDTLEYIPPVTPALKRKGAQHQVDPSTGSGLEAPRSSVVGKRQKSGDETGTRSTCDSGSVELLGQTTTGGRKKAGKRSGATGQRSRGRGTVRGKTSKGRGAKRKKDYEGESEDDGGDNDKDEELYIEELPRKALQYA